jgi:type IV pilus assembly protein PilP
MSTAPTIKRQIRPAAASVVRVAILCAASIALSGCIDRDMSDLESYEQKILARKGSRIDELPPIEPYEIHIYASTDGSDPFEAFYKESRTPAEDTEDGKNRSGLRPNEDRNPEELEGYSLDSLRMMGTVELNAELWGILRSPDGTIHRVQVGNYIGRNHGKIISISEESIDLNEIVDDGQGGYQERSAAVALAEQ